MEKIKISKTAFIPDGNVIMIGHSAGGKDILNAANSTSESINLVMTMEPVSVNAGGGTAYSSEPYSVTLGTNVQNIISLSAENNMFTGGGGLKSNNDQKIYSGQLKGTSHVNIDDSITPDRPGTEKGQVWTDSDGTFTWDGGMWRDSNGAGISYKETQIEGVTVSGGSKSSSNNVSWLWYSGYNIAKDSHIRLNYYYPNNRLIYNNYTSPAEYAFYRYHLQQSTRAQLSTQGQAMSQILKTKEAQLATAKYYASKGINPSGRIRGGAGTAQILRGAGTAVVVVSAGMSIYNVATADNKAQALSGEIGGWTGAWAGAEYGAMIGSFAGPWGTVIGGVVGGAVGYYYGSETGTELYNTLSE